MRKIQFLSQAGLITLWVLCLLYQPAQAQDQTKALTQDPYSGIWEGTFMNDFRTAILLDLQENGGYAGKILMYSGDQQIQNDEITLIQVNKQALSFYIAAKETTFQGTFDPALTELSGTFVFPDKSEHPLVVRKAEKKAPGDSAAEPAKLTEPTQDNTFGKKIPVEELKADFLYLINKLREYHPRLYSYTSEDTFNGMVSHAHSKLDRDMSLEAFYLEIAPLVAAVKCSHTGIHLPASYRAYLQEQGNFFPLELYIRGKEAFSLSPCGPEKGGLAPGTQILSINGQPMGRIIETLLSIIPAEGNCQTTKYQEINRNFHRYFHLLDPSDRFQIQYRSATGPEKLVAEACPYAELKKEEAPGSKPAADFDFEVDQEAGILEISSFGIRDMEGYFAFLDTVFLRLKQEEIPHLVLDLRNNEGGHPIFAAQLFSYLTDHTFTYFQENADVPDFEPLYHPMQPNMLHYTGKIFVLVNGSCLSTTGHLISLLKFHTPAIFIGEEPGSTFLCNDFSMPLSLPYSGMEVNIPRTTFITAVSGLNEMHPFRVDHKVDVPVEDIMNKEDTYLLYIQSLLSESQS